MVRTGRKTQVVENLSRILNTKLPTATVILLDAIAKQSEQQGAPIYLVGGCVRDILLGRPNLDLDLVLEGDAVQLGHALAKRFGGRLVAHKAFGTAVWWLPEDQSRLLRELHRSKKLHLAPGAKPQVKRKNAHLPEFFDLITARRESYEYPGALPKVQFAGIREDQYRRDFTVNTLAVRLDGDDAGQLLDPWGGLQDLNAGLLRTLHPFSFSDDPTRILRILRLAGRLGFQIEKETRSHLKTYLPVLKQVSGERIRTELELVLLEKERVSILQSLQKLGVLATVHPKLELSHESTRALDVRYPKNIPASWNLGAFVPSDLGFILWLMDVAPADIADIAKRLSFRADLREAIIAAAQLQTMKTKLRTLPVSKMVELLEKMSTLAVYAVYLPNQGSVVAERLKLYVSKWRKIHPHTDGNTLRKLGLKPGPTYKRILSRLRAAWLDGEIRSANQEQVLLEKLLNEHR